MTLVRGGIDGMLIVNDLWTRYGTVPCLKGVSFEVQRGEVVTLIGANGAGKTTTLLALCGVVPVERGEIVWEGRSLRGLRPEAIVRAGISQVPEGRHVFPHLTVSENLSLGAFQVRDRRIVRQRRAALMEQFPILRERRAQLAGSLSGGEQQVLAIARGLMAAPRLLLLDEPSLGLAPKWVAEVFQIIRRISADGTTILLVEQNAHLALQVATRGYVLETGQVRLANRAAELMRDPVVKQAYLGG